MADTLADAANPQRWLEGLSSSLSGEEQAMLTRAFDEARTLYCGKTMAQTGEDLFNHAVAAAAIVADLNLLPDAIVATLMFAASDYREDWRPWLSETFNPTVAVLVEGVNGVRRITELARIDKLSTPEERARQAETMRKMLLAMVADIRVVLIKLAWRTQTMHYLAEVEDETVRRRIATETLDLFAPLANRLGCGRSSGSWRTWASAIPSRIATSASPSCWTSAGWSASTISTVCWTPCAWS